MCPLPPVRASMITSLLATILSACVQSPSISEMSPQDEKSGVLFAEWVELGTRSGPIPGTDRSQPSHLLRVDNQVILVDVGDGTTQLYEVVDEYVVVHAAPVHNIPPRL